MTAPVCVRGGVLTPHDQDVVDTFREFLQLRAGVALRVADGRYTVGDQLPPWHRYAMRFAVWRMNAIGERD